MKKLLYLSALIIAASCGDNKEVVETATAVVNKHDSTEVFPTDSSSFPTPLQEGVETSYIGDFEAVDAKPDRVYYYKNKINITIDSLRGNEIFGHSVVAGNQRPFSGTYSLTNGVHKVSAVEPGDDKYDGKFEFDLNGNAGTIEGTWTANNTKLEVNKRKYKLNKGTFSYSASANLPESLSGEIVSEWNNISKFEEDASTAEMITADAMKINASAVKLKKEDVENMYKGDLELMRNAIYARHGYSFKSKKMRYIFDNLVDWYIPYTTDVRNELTELEKENIALIKRYEKHANVYYDSYGR
ncbi:MAG TPA: YARHG domain-containing protein [Bacteroidia bacterium]